MSSRIYIYYFILLSVLFQGCYSLRERKMLKQLNGKIPATSKWLGGKDGGKWVNIIILPQNTIELFVYNDFTGEKIAELVYESSCSKINEKLVLEALNFYADGMHWRSDKAITKCIKLRETR